MASKDDVLKRALKKELPVALGAEELDRKKIELADTCVEEADVEQQAKDAAAGHRGRLKELRKDKRKLAREIQAKKAKQETDCHEVFEYATGSYYITVDSTGAEVEGTRRALTPKELEVPLIEVDGDAIAEAANGSGATPKAKANGKKDTPPGAKRTKKAKAPAREARPH